MNIVRRSATFDDIRREAKQLRASGLWFRRQALMMHDRVDRDSRTIPAVIATENPVLFWDPQRRRVSREVLVASGGMLFPWVPMLRMHQSWALEMSLGSVLNSRMVGRQIQADLQFAEAEDVQPVWSRVRDGHLRGVSIGGRRVEFTDIEPGQVATVAGRRWIAGKFPLRVTTKWIEREASVVLFGADGGPATH
ncbi:hypothetical protein [Crateriforma conspicua]|uniref:Uncharacterized protein n=1 Tax=Crateriforma conspicua TaxID=2527996 RepID=A0A5C6FTU6_9PLAN|nr:hypothetical protein [Crateriforma conspicua]TWU66462.1 hypothetical protein V7x_20280 [Crateriforma conspicua]